MSTDKKTETAKQQKTDTLIETTKKDDVALNEEELKRAAGGVLIGLIKPGMDGATKQ